MIVTANDLLELLSYPCVCITINIKEKTHKHIQQGKIKRSPLKNLVNNLNCMSARPRPRGKSFQTLHKFLYIPRKTLKLTSQPFLPLLLLLFLPYPYSYPLSSCPTPRFLLNFLALYFILFSFLFFSFFTLFVSLVGEITKFLFCFSYGLNVGIVFVVYRSSQLTPIRYGDKKKQTKNSYK